MGGAFIVTPTDAIGYVAAAFTTLAFVPQVRKSWRSNSSSDLSMGMLATFTIGVVMWLIYGLALASPPMILANGATLVLNLILIALKIRHQGTRI